jgi:hypothetical protein
MIMMVQLTIHEKKCSDFYINYPNMMTLCEPEL